MLRSAAIARIQRGLGFRTDLNDAIILSLQEAQRELERGKTLPKFLLQEDQTLTLLEGEHAVALPAGFIREVYDEPLRFTPTNSRSTRFIRNGSLRQIIRVYHDSEFDQYSTEPQLPGPPIAYMIRKTTVDFYNTADQDYDLLWSYYASGAPLTSDVENEWLADANAPEWLIGEAGMRIAMDLRDATAISLFKEMASKARASCFGEIIAAEEAGGPHHLGEGV